MDYGMTVQTAAPFADTVARVRQVLKEQGSGNAGSQPDLPAGGCELGAMAITEGDRTSPGRCAVFARRSPPGARRPLSSTLTALRRSAPAWAAAGLSALPPSGPGIDY